MWEIPATQTITHMIKGCFKATMYCLFWSTWYAFTCVVLYWRSVLMGTATVLLFLYLLCRFVNICYYNSPLVYQVDISPIQKYLDNLEFNQVLSLCVACTSTCKHLFQVLLLIIHLHFVWLQPSCPGCTFMPVCNNYVSVTVYLTAFHGNIIILLNRLCVQRRGCCVGWRICWCEPCRNTTIINFVLATFRISANSLQEQFKYQFLICVRYKT